MLKVLLSMLYVVCWLGIYSDKVNSLLLSDSLMAVLAPSINVPNLQNSFFAHGSHAIEGTMSWLYFCSVVCYTDENWIWKLRKRIIFQYIYSCDEIQASLMSCFSFMGKMGNNNINFFHCRLSNNDLFLGSPTFGNLLKMLQPIPSTEINARSKKSCFYYETPAG